MTQKQWLAAVILTLITISAWVIFDILHSRTQVEIPQKWQGVVEPINPRFDTQALE